MWWRQVYRIFRSITGRYSQDSPPKTRLLQNIFVKIRCSRNPEKCYCHWNREVLKTIFFLGLGDNEGEINKNKTK
jgi:hypothetical protein